MFKHLFSPNERWCFPEVPPYGPPADPDERWCFPEDPPRRPVMDPDERWCFPENPPRDRRTRARRHVHHA